MAPLSASASEPQGSQWVGHCFALRAAPIRLGTGQLQWAIYHCSGEKKFIEELFEAKLRVISRLIKARSLLGPITFLAGNSFISNLNWPAPAS